jgi:hypothetical protein
MAWPSVAVFASANSAFREPDPPGEARGAGAGGPAHAGSDPVAVGSGELSEDELADWLRPRMVDRVKGLSG